MKPSALILSLALTLGSFAQAAPASADTPPTGVSMNAAKRLDTRTPLDGLTRSAKLSGVPMVVAARHGASIQVDRTRSDLTLSGIPLALAKRL